MSRRSARRAAKPPPVRHELKDIGYEIFVAAVSVLAIVNLLLLYVVEAQSLATVLLVMNIVLSVIFCLAHPFSSEMGGATRAVAMLTTFLAGWMLGLCYGKTGARRPSEQGQV